ncbi:MAG: hypothetical protein ACOX1O_06095 [Eggerthellaceae bacterium]|jgi:hypothetical protein
MKSLQSHPVLSGAVRPLSIRLAASVLFLAACLLALLVSAPMEAQAKSVNPYGLISAQYESGSDPACIVSGIAYGAYQMTPKNTYAFCRWMGKRDKNAKAYSKKLLAAYKKDKKKCGTHFDKAWKSIAKAHPKAFHRYQYLYVKSISYTPTVRYLQANVKGFKVSRYTNALRNVIFSTAVQHGSWGAYKIIAKAYRSGKGEKKLVSKIYGIRAGYSKAKSIKKSVGKGVTVNAIKSADCRWYVANGLLSKKEASKLKGKALLNFYSCSSAEQVGVYYRLQKCEKVTALNLYRQYA